MPAVNAAEIVKALPNDRPFTLDVLKKIYTQAGEQITDENLKVRAARLKAQGVIISTGRGWYRLNDKRLFEPEITAGLKKAHNTVTKAFPYLNFLLWSSQWVNTLATLQLLQNLTVVEVENGSEAAVFGALKTGFGNRVFLNPTGKEWSHYIAEKEAAIVIRPLIGESPKENRQGIKTPKLEKILVDLYCDTLWQLLFGAEMSTVYREACLHYTLNFSTLLRYAARRGKRAEIAHYIKDLGVLDAATRKLIQK